MKKILITGCSGYIGSHLCHLLQDKYEIHGLDIEFPNTPISKFYKIDIDNQFSIDCDYDAVVHLAALIKVGESQKIPLRYYKTNVQGTINVLTGVNTKNFIFASTGAAESCSSVYAITKLAAEEFVKRMSPSHTIFRFYNVIGSTIATTKNEEGLIRNLIAALETGTFTICGSDYPTKDGTCVRDYVHVNEICKSIEIAIETPANNIECLGHGIGHTVKEIVDIFQNVNNCKFDVVYGPRREGDSADCVLKSVSLYIKPTYTIEDMLKLGTK